MMARTTRTTSRCQESFGSMFGPDQIEIERDDDLPSWQQRVILSLENDSAEYDLVVTEDSDYVILESRVAEIKPPSEQLYALLHDINADTFEGKVVVERGLGGDSQHDGAEDDGYDAIFFTKQIRKAGVPDGTIVDEIVEFDHGLSRVYKGVRTAVESLGLDLETDSSVTEDRLGSHASRTRLSPRRYVVNHLGEALNEPE